MLISKNALKLSLTCLLSMIGCSNQSDFEITHKSQKIPRKNEVTKTSSQKQPAQEFCCKQTSIDDSKSSGIVLQISSKKLKDNRVLQYFEPLEITLINNSSEVFRFPNPKSKKGYFQLKFEFTDTESQKKYVVKKRSIADDDYWDSLKSYDGFKEIKSGESYSYELTLPGYTWGGREWHGLPGPNSNVCWEITAQFCPNILPQDSKIENRQTVYQSQKHIAKIIAEGLKTPHDYLWSNFPKQALELLKSEPKWIHKKDRNSRTPLHIAARFNHLEVVQWLLENGVDINATAYNGFTPLHLARNPEVYEKIIAFGPDLSIRCNVQNRTIFEDAFWNVRESRSEELKQKWRGITNIILDSGVEIDILSAIHLNDLKRVKTILKQSPKFAHRFCNESPLRTAVILNRFETCKHLIEEHSVDLNEFESGTGYPILVNALPNPKIVRLLVESGADLKTRITWMGGRSGIWTIGDNATILHLAARDGKPETVKFLIDSRVDLFATAKELSAEKSEQNAFDVATSFGKIDNLKFMLNCKQFMESEKQSQEDIINKCFMHSAYTNSTLMELLLKKGANPNVSDKNGTVIQKIASQIHPGKLDIKEEDSESIKKIRMAIQYGAKIDMFTAIAINDEKQVIKFLKSNPKLSNSRSPDGYPVLHLAVKMNDLGIIRQLLKANCNLEIRNKSKFNGDTEDAALHCAAFWNRLEAAKLLINSGANVNALNKRKSTPLHETIRMNKYKKNIELIKLLIKNGAAVDLKDIEGKTPLDLANKNVLELFKSK